MSAARSVAIMTDSPQTLIWPLFVELMCAPLPPGRAIRGTIRANEREVWFASSWSAEIGPPVVAAPLAAADDDGSMTAIMQDERLRLDSPSGEPYLIVGRDTAWKFTPGDGVPDADDPAAFRFEGALMHLVTRPTYDRFIGHDFAKPDGPIVATTFLGRPAWQVTLKPPKHKPCPLHWIVDAETGMLLRQANEGIDTVAEWTSFEVIDAVDENVFTWDGPSRTVEARAAEWAERERHIDAERADYLEHVLGVSDPVIAVTAKPTVLVHEWHDDGSFSASLDSPGGYITRRPLAQGPQDHDFSGNSDEHTWTQGPWRWDLFLRGGYTLTEEQLRAFQAVFHALPDA